MPKKEYSDYYEITVWKCDSETGVPYAQMFNVTRRSISKEHVEEILQRLATGFPQPEFVIKVFHINQTREQL